MSYVKFDKGQLVNLEYSLQREILQSNRTGTYLSTTLNGCNTRKYHGLLVTPIKEFVGEKHVLLSALDPTFIQHGSEFNLGIHRFQGGTYDPGGHKYIREVEFKKLPVITYRVGGVVLVMERLLVEHEQQVIIRYTLVEANSPTVLRLRPFLAFRNIHSLSKANLYVNRKYHTISNGIKIRLYDGYPYLSMQMNKKCEFIPVPDWYYNIEYTKERSRGYEYLEDLYVPGYFEVAIKEGESILFSASTFEDKPRMLKKKFTGELSKKRNLDSFTAFLQNASEQFIQKRGRETNLISGFPWYGSDTRQALVALPGIVLSTGNTNLYRKVLRTYANHLHEGLFPRSIELKIPDYSATDIPLWFFWAIQQWVKTEKNGKWIWREFGDHLKLILTTYLKGLSFNNKMLSNGLVYAGKDRTALTWMDSQIDGIPLVQRKGLTVEINALWYNAVGVAVELAEQANDHLFLTEWEGMHERIKDSFKKSFWLEDDGYLADCIDANNIDRSVRPNMVIATALDYSPLTREQKKKVLAVCRDQLLTPRGLRTLAPHHENYAGNVKGNHAEREKGIHQGAAWPWLIRFFAEGYLKVHRQGGVPFVKEILKKFEEELSEHCIGTLSEMYNGNPPHEAKGAFSQAWSVAAIVAALKMTEQYETG